MQSYFMTSIPVNLIDSSPRITPYNELIYSYLRCDIPVVTGL